MLTFFRKIRKSFIDSSSARKYILYAIGEILLVMIGILLALQVNNWNEWRKDRVAEKEILTELTVTLEKNIEGIHSSNETANRNNNSREIIISLFNEKQPYSDSLKGHFFMSSLGYEISTLTYGGYEMLKNEGFQILRSVRLRKEIVNLFEINFMNLEKEEMEKRSDVYVEDVARYLINNFAERRVPINYKALLNDQFYFENLIAMQEHEHWLIRKRIKTLEETQRVLQLIKEELQSTERL
jgi:hypothetical protein